MSVIKVVSTLESFMEYTNRRPLWVPTASVEALLLCWNEEY